jgi:hypothetical protein
VVSQVKNQIIIEAICDLFYSQHGVSMRQVNPIKASKEKTKLMLPHNKNNAWFFQRLIKQSQSFEISHATENITKHTIKMISSTTWKSLSRSLNKLLFVPLFCMKLFLFSNTIRTFLAQLFRWKPTWTRGKNTPWCKDITRSEQKSRQKMKAKCSSRKREHSLNDKSEN